MNTTTPRARAGQPYVPPFPTRRVMPEQVKREAMPIDFVLPDEDEQAVRDGFDAVMKMPISKPVEDELKAAHQRRMAEQARGMRNAIPQHVETASVDDAKDVRTADFAFWAWAALMWTVIWFCLGIVYSRHFY